MPLSPSSCAAIKPGQSSRESWSGSFGVYQAKNSTRKVVRHDSSAEESRACQINSSGAGDWKINQSSPSSQRLLEETQICVNTFWGGSKKFVCSFQCVCLVSSCSPLWGSIDFLFFLFFLRLILSWKGPALLDLASYKILCHKLWVWAVSRALITTDPTQSVGLTGIYQELFPRALIVSAAWNLSIDK